MSTLLHDRTVSGLSMCGSRVCCQHWCEFTCAVVLLCAQTCFSCSSPLGQNILLLLYYMDIALNWLPMTDCHIHRWTRPSALTREVLAVVDDGSCWDPQLIRVQWETVEFSAPDGTREHGLILPESFPVFYTMSYYVTILWFHQLLPLALVFLFFSNPFGCHHQCRDGSVSV